MPTTLTSTTTQGKGSAKRIPTRTLNRRADRLVAEYINAVHSDRRPTRGHPVDTQKAQADCQRLEAQLSTLKQGSRHLAVTKRLAQRRLLLERELAYQQFRALERDFVLVAKGYHERHGMTYRAWRSLSVRAETLREAGISSH